MAPVTSKLKACTVPMCHLFVSYRQLPPHKCLTDAEDIAAAGATSTRHTTSNTPGATTPREIQLPQAWMLRGLTMIEYKTWSGYCSIQQSTPAHQEQGDKEE